MASRSTSRSGCVASGSSNGKRKQRNSLPVQKITSQEQFNKFLDQCNTEVFVRANAFSSYVQSCNMPKVVLDCLPTGAYRHSTQADRDANQPEFSFYVPMGIFLELIKDRPALNAQAHKINRELTEHKTSGHSAFESRLCIYFTGKAVAYIVDLIAREFKAKVDSGKKGHAPGSFKSQLSEEESPIPHTTESDVEFAVTRACDAFVFGENWHTPANETEYYQHMRQYIRVPGQYAENVYFLSGIFGFEQLKSQCEASVAYYWGCHVRNQLFASLPSFEFLKAKLQFSGEASSVVLQNFLLVLINARGLTFDELLQLYELVLVKGGDDINTALLVERIIASNSMITVLTVEEKLSVMFYSLGANPAFRHRMLRSVIMRNVDSPSLRARACDYMREEINSMIKYSRQRVVFVLDGQNLTNPKLQAKLMPASGGNHSSAGKNSKSFFKSPLSAPTSNNDTKKGQSRHFIDLTLGSTTYDLCCRLYMLLSSQSKLPVTASEQVWPLNFQFLQIRELPAEENGFSMLGERDDGADHERQRKNAGTRATPRTTTWHAMPFLYSPEPVSSGMFGVQRPILLNDPLSSMLSITLNYPVQHDFVPNTMYELRITAETEDQLFSQKWKWNDSKMNQPSQKQHQQQPPQQQRAKSNAVDATVMQHIGVVAPSPSTRFSSKSSRAHATTTEDEQSESAGDDMYGEEVDEDGQRRTWSREEEEEGEPNEAEYEDEQ